MTPITIALAHQLGVDPRPLIIGTSACFATPIGYQANALVHATGYYRFADFVRIGVPLNLVVDWSFADRWCCSDRFKAIGLRSALPPCRMWGHKRGRAK